MFRPLCLVSFFVFHAKLGYTFIHRNGSSDGSFLLSPPLKLSFFLSVLRIITDKFVIFITMSDIRNKSVHSCQLVHHAKFHCMVTTLNKLFKIEFERVELGKNPSDKSY